MSVSLKTPDKEDAAELAPLLVGLAVWFVTSHSKRRALPMLLPILAAIAAWVLLKGLIYVPE